MLFLPSFFLFCPISQRRLNHRRTNTLSTNRLVDELLCLEETPQVEHLPGGQAQQTADRKDAQVEHTSVRRLCDRDGERGARSVLSEDFEWKDQNRSPNSPFVSLISSSLLRICSKSCTIDADRSSILVSSSSIGFSLPTAAICVRVKV